MNTNQAVRLIDIATDFAYRADEVRQEPAVIKSFHKFCDDSRVAVKSGGEFAQEVAAAWHRSGRK